MAAHRRRFEQPLRVILVRSVYHAGSIAGRVGRFGGERDDQRRKFPGRPKRTSGGGTVGPGLAGKGSSFPAGNPDRVKPRRAAFLWKWSRASPVGAQNTFPVYRLRL